MRKKAKKKTVRRRPKAKTITFVILPEKKGFVKMYICENRHLIERLKRYPGDRVEYFGQMCRTEDEYLCPICGGCAVPALQCGQCGQWFDPSESETDVICDSCLEERITDKEVYEYCRDRDIRTAVEINDLLLCYFSRKDIEELLWQALTGTVEARDKAEQVVDGNIDDFAEWLEGRLE